MEVLAEVKVVGSLDGVREMLCGVCGEVRDGLRDPSEILSYTLVSLDELEEVSHFFNELIITTHGIFVAEYNDSDLEYF